MLFTKYMQIVNYFKYNEIEIVDSLFNTKKEKDAEI